MKLNKTEVFLFHGKFGNRRGTNPDWGDLPEYGKTKHGFWYFACLYDDGEGDLEGPFKSEQEAADIQGQFWSREHKVRFSHIWLGHTKDAHAAFRAEFMK